MSGCNLFQLQQDPLLWCEGLATSHYENFPVAPVFLPRAFRKPIVLIYAFARTADDIADDPLRSKEERLAALHAYWSELERIKEGKPQANGFFGLLSEMIIAYKLPLELFFDLLRAFIQDVTQSTYATYQDILNYCQYSACPVGRLLLCLAGEATSENLKDSDAICTALQLINFLQDLRSDLLHLRRCYLPQDEMKAGGVTVEDLQAGKTSETISCLIQQQQKRAEVLLLQGSGLGRRLKGRFGLVIRMMIEGGQRTIQLLDKRQSIYDCPRLKKRDKLVLFFKATPLWRGSGQTQFS